MGLFVPQRHWSPRYIADRVRWGTWQRRNPTLPWLVPQAVEFLEQWIRPTDVLVEYGSGRSTTWFAARCARVISVEDHPEWYAKIKAQIEIAGFTNVSYFLAPDDEDRSHGNRIRVQRNPEPYVRAPESILNGARADIILIDGMNRDECAHWSVDHIRPGGLIILDNANFFLPSRTRSPGSVTDAQPPATERWKEWVARTAAWRRMWFANGVADTLFIFAPA